MPALTDTGAYPVFDGATAKQALLRALWAEIQPNCPNGAAIIARINNSDLSALTDGATVYDTADCFGASV